MKQSIYQIWQVFENEKRAKFYVINTTTKQVQSSWTNYLEAKSVSDKLNKEVA